MKKKGILESSMLAAVLGLGAAIAPMAATAAITGTTGSINWLVSPPTDVQNGVHADGKVYAFDEQTNVYLDPGIDNVYLGGSGTNLGTISAGTTVNSTYVFIDAGTEHNNSGEGTITFSTDILGIIWDHNEMNATDGVLGLGTVTYASGNRGAGGFPTTDVFSFTANTATFNLTDFDTSAGNYDSIRVLTAVPLPAAVWLFGSAILGLTLIGRRRKALNA